jgi:hypothetical protein
MVTVCHSGCGGNRGGQRSQAPGRRALCHEEGEIYPETVSRRSQRVGSSFRQAVRVIEGCDGRLDYLRIVVAALPKDMNMSLSTQQRRLELLTDAELTAIIRDSEQFLEAPKDE